MTTIASRPALLPCPAWCDGQHEHDDVEGNGCRFHYGPESRVEGHGDAGMVWSWPYALEYVLTRHDDYRQCEPTAETRLRITELSGGADFTVEDLRGLAAWLLERADDLARMNA